MSAILRKWKQQPIDWHDLTTQAKLSHLLTALQEEDEITYIDKGGIARTAVAAKVTPTGAYGVAFGFLIGSRSKQSPPRKGRNYPHREVSMSYKDGIPYLRQLWLLLKFAVRRLFGRSGA